MQLDLHPIVSDLIELSQGRRWLSYEELSEVTGLSVSTLEREIRFSRAWLTARLGEG